MPSTVSTVWDAALLSSLPAPSSSTEKQLRATVLLTLFSSMSKGIGLGSFTLVAVEVTFVVATEMEFWFTLSVLSPFPSFGDTCIMPALLSPCVSCGCLYHVITKVEVHGVLLGGWWDGLDVTDQRNGVLRVQLTKKLIFTLLTPMSSVPWKRSNATERFLALVSFSSRRSPWGQ